MRELKFYKLLLPLPLVVSAVLLPLFYVDLNLPHWLQIVIFTTVASGLAGGIPYLVLVALLLFWGRGKTEKQFRRALMLSPVLMIPIYFLFSLSLGIVIERESFSWQSAGWDTALTLAFFALCILGYGYAYVVIGLTAVFVLRRFGLIYASNAI
jgi:hypothetical protein